MKTNLSVLFLLLTLVACNTVKDINPQNSPISNGMIAIINERFPNVENIQFTPLVENKIWNADFASAQNQYNVTVSPTNILASYRVAASSVPDSLSAIIAQTVIKGGEFSNFREETYSWVNDGNYGKTYWADYKWNNEKFALKWGVTYLQGSFTYDVNLYPAKTKILSSNLADLPSKIRQYLSTKALDFSRATIYVSEDGSKLYEVQLKKGTSYFDLLFNTDENLVAGSDSVTALTSLQEVPAAIQTYLSSQNVYNGFGLSGQFAHVFKKEFDGVISYHVGVQKHSGTFYGSQAWFITFDQQGNPLTRNYLGLY